MAPYYECVRLAIEYGEEHKFPTFDGGCKNICDPAKPGIPDYDWKEYIIANKNIKNDSVFRCPGTAGYTEISIIALQCSACELLPKYPLEESTGDQVDPEEWKEFRDGGTFGAENSQSQDAGVPVPEPAQDGGTK